METLSLSLSVQRWTCITRYQNVSILDFIGAKDDGVAVTTEAIRRAKLQSNRHQQIDTQFFTGRMPFPAPNQHCPSTDGKIVILEKKPAKRKPNVHVCAR